MQRYLRQIMDEKLPGGGNLEFSCTEVSLVLTQGAPYEGTFTVIGSGQGVSKGYLLSTDRRVECLTTEFTGAEETLHTRDCIQSTTRHVKPCGKQGGPPSKPKY